jgi:anionic cell wall polymer biosynthesis LytR-Cps2A-Psr (LCP) family protein
MEKRNLNEYPDPGDLSTNEVASSTECTGLMQSLPSEEDDIKSYEDIYEIPDQGSEKELQNEYKKEQSTF